MKSDQHIAPICLFVYGRPEHTQKTLDSLSENPLAKESELYIYADGPKEDISEQGLQKVNQVRQIIESVDFCKKTHLVVSEKNKGLANSIIEGVTAVLEKHDRAIILEDDLMLSPYFLTYMNEALHFYEQHEQVMHIAGFTPGFKRKMEDTFFFPVPTCWGWATWKRAWDHFNPSASDLMTKVLEKGKKRFDFNRSINYVRMLDRNIHGKVDSWFIRWYASVFLKDGLCLHPGKSLVQNIGLDHSGVNSYKSNVFETQLAQHIEIRDIPLRLSKAAIKNYIRFNWKVKLMHTPEYIWRVLTRNVDT
jgi:hypothetical protein